jgi:hypothetical protein
MSAYKSFNDDDLEEGFDDNYYHLTEDSQADFNAINNELDEHFDDEVAPASNPVETEPVAEVKVEDVGEPEPVAEVVESPSLLDRLRSNWIYLLILLLVVMLGVYYAVDKGMLVLPSLPSFSSASITEPLSTSSSSFSNASSDLGKKIGKALGL